jgi:tetratricopeptide (TPR) repeat protein
MRNRELLASILLLMAPVARSGAAATSSGLPPVACLEATRSARIALAKGDADGARKRLEAAIDLPGCELPALSRLVTQLRERSDAALRFAELRDRLAARLGDPSTELPDGLLTQLVGDRAEPANDLPLLAALKARLAASPEATPLPGQRAELLHAIAELELRLGRDAEARASFGKLLEVSPTDGLRWRVLMLDVDGERWENAEALLLPMLAEPEAPVVLRYLHATALAHLGRFEELLRLLDQLAPAPPDPATAVAVAAPQTPEEALQAALHPSPFDDFAGLLLRTAWAMRDAGREADAAALFRRALLYAPASPEAQGALLHLYGTAEERAASAAAAESRRAQETDPQRLFEEGSDLLGAGDAKGARELLARAAPELAGSGYAEPAWYNLGTANFKLERWAEAADAFAQALAVNPDRPEGLWKRAVALYHLARCSEAVALFGTLLERNPAKRDAHYYLSGCYAKLGDAAAAARESAIFNAKP